MENEAHTNQTVQQTAPSGMPIGETPAVSVSQTPQKSGFSKIPRYFLSHKKIVVILLLIIIILTIPLLLIFLNNRNEANNLRETGISAFYSGDFATAKKDLKNSISNDPNNPTTQAILIKTIANEGNHNGNEKDSFAEGKNYADQALKTNPNNSDVLVAVGYLYETSGRYQEALNYYSKAIQLDPQNADAYFHKGHVLEFLNMPDQANENYQKAYSLNPDDVYIMMAQARILLASGKADQAIDMFKKASSAFHIPPFIKAEALTNAAIIQRSQILKLTESLKLAKEAVDADPAYSPALAEYALNLFMTGDMNGAIKNMEAAIKANPRIAQNYWRLGAFYKVGKNYTKAIDLQEEALSKLDNDNTILSEKSKNLIQSMIAYDLASTYYKAGLNDKALLNLKLAISLNSTMKNTLKVGYDKFGDFKDLSSNPDFKLLIQ